jgi:SAM-dependent methyltransferase
MKRLDIVYDRERFWQDYWLEHGIDHEEFRDLEIYPIRMTLRHVKPGEKILECGCGAGRVIRHLAKEGYDIIGLEYDRNIVEKLKTCQPPIKVVEGDASKIQFSDNSFDVSLCFGTVGPLHDKTAAAIRELQRVTRPGGTVVLSVMLNNTARFLQKLQNRLMSRGPTTFYAWMDSEDGWRSYFESFGLQVLESEPMVSRYNLYYWTSLLRTKEKSDLTLARVDDTAYKLNFIGRCLWTIHRTIARKSLASGITFAMKNNK